ncbi:MAG: ferredoxin--NADP(+) reductase [Planctomycetota bacterium]|nr:MAG: ferredoxin--NADP(+) reductase [Planctomycetota bacterium]
MASAPGEPPEFLVERVPGGALSPRLCALNPGATLLWDPRPAGRFTLERVGSGESLWLVATGAGLAPFVSMLRSGEPWRRFRRVVLVHAVAHPGQLAYREELAALGAARGDGWASLARTGADATPEALAAALADGRLEAAAGAPLDARAQVLLCGDPRVLDAARAALEARGLRRNRPRAPGQITSEKYWA